MACRHSVNIATPKILRLPRPPNSLFPFLYLQNSKRGFAKSATSARKRQHPEDVNKAQIPVDPAQGGYIPWDSATPSNDVAAYPDNFRSTMTNIEKDAFASLFGTLVSKPSAPTEDSSTSAQPIKSHQRKPKATQQQSYMTALEDEIRSTNIEDQSASSSSNLGADFDISHIYAEQLAPEAIASLERYPAAIRDMAKRASILRVLEQERTQSQDPLVTKANAEMQRIETLLRACETDKQIYRVMHDEVFDKVLKAANADKPRAPPEEENSEEEEEEAEKAAATTNSQKASNPKKQKKAKKLPTTPGTSKEEAEVKSSETLQLLTHTYAPLMLLSVRLLLHANPRSAMAATLLQTALSLGPTSYALAASTPLYNALLKQKWATTMQYTPLFALLQEMENAGLSMDRTTLETIEEIAEYRRRALWGWFGRAVKAVEEARVRFTEGEQIEGWRERIWASIQEMEIERARMAQERRVIEWEERQDEVQAQAQALAELQRGHEHEHEHEHEQPRATVSAATA